MVYSKLDSREIVSDFWAAGACPSSRPGGVDTLRAASGAPGLTRRADDLTPRPSIQQNVQKAMREAVRPLTIRIRSRDSQPGGKAIVGYDHTWLYDRIAVDDAILPARCASNGRKVKPDGVIQPLRTTGVYPPVHPPCPRRRWRLRPKPLVPVLTTPRGSRTTGESARWRGTQK
jgi:hypothetical protein